MRRGPSEANTICFILVQKSFALIPSGSQCLASHIVFTLKWLEVYQLEILPFMGWTERQCSWRVKEAGNDAGSGQWLLYMDGVLDSETSSGYNQGWGKQRGKPRPTPSLSPRPPNATPMDYFLLFFHLVSMSLFIQWNAHVQSEGTALACSFLRQ